MQECIGTFVDHGWVTIEDPAATSWLFRSFAFVGARFEDLLGFVSLIVLLAIVANIPIFQLAALGYLIESMGRVIRQRRLGSALVGIDKARTFGSIFLGIWLIILPMRALAGFWQDAWLIDPESAQTAFLRVLQAVLIPLMMVHIATCILCGGKLRHFLWPLLAPVLLVFRFTRSNRVSRWMLDRTIGRLFPVLAADIYNATPLGDWFVPSMMWKKLRYNSALVIFQQARDCTLDFIAGLRPGYYWFFGAKAFLGTLIWLAIPTALMASPSGLQQGPAAIIGVVGMVAAVPVFFLLPFLQCNFAVHGKFANLFQIRRVLKNYSRAPLAGALALLVTGVFAVPLFLAKIEQVPSEFFWMLSVVFVLFTWPAKVFTAWAFSRGYWNGQEKDTYARFWLRWPLILTGAALAFAFALILFLSQYTSWNGGRSLFENHAFLLPTPFWL
jgi:hypothetical protein